MPEHIRRRWKPPIKTLVADIHGWLEDMYSTRQFVHRLIQTLDHPTADPVIIDALSSAALVRYSRCFTTGIRKQLSINQLTSASIADAAIHDRLRGVRDWHLAHPVNEQEVHALYVILDEAPNATGGAVGFSSFSSADLALRPEEAHAALQLCDKWIAWLTQIFISEQGVLLPLANQLSREQLLALPRDEPEPNQNVHARRRQRTR